MIEVHYHKHHIIPKHAGGTDEATNIALLTIEEHALAHKKLYEQYGKWQDLKAWKGLAGILNKNDYEYLRNIGKGPRKPRIKGIFKHSNITKEKMRNKALGRARTYESKIKQKNSVIGNKNHFFGKTHSDEFKKRQSEIKKITQAGSNNSRAIPVKVVDKNGESYWGCIKDYADHFNLPKHRVNYFFREYSKDKNFRPKSDDVISSIISIERIKK